MHSRAAESGPMPGGPEVFQEQGVGRNSGRHDKACQKAADGQQQCAGSSSGGTMSPHGTRARWEEDGQSMCRAMGGAATSLHLSNQREGAQCIASAVAGCNCRMGAGEFEASATRTWYRELRGGGHLGNANSCVAHLRVRGLKRGCIWSGDTACAMFLVAGLLTFATRCDCLRLRPGLPASVINKGHWPGGSGAFVPLFPPSGCLLDDKRLRGGGGVGSVSGGMRASRKQQIMPAFFWRSAAESQADNAKCRTNLELESYPGRRTFFCDRCGHKNTKPTAAAQKNSARSRSAPSDSQKTVPFAGHGVVTPRLKRSRSFEISELAAYGLRAFGAPPQRRVMRPFNDPALARAGGGRTALMMAKNGAGGGVEGGAEKAQSTRGEGKKQKIRKLRTSKSETSLDRFLRVGSMGAVNGTATIVQSMGGYNALVAVKDAVDTTAGNGCGLRVFGKDGVDTKCGMS